MEVQGGLDNEDPPPSVAALLESGAAGDQLRRDGCLVRAARAAPLVWRLQSAFCSSP